MSKNVKIRRGVDIKLKGKADKVFANLSSETYVLKPTDFYGLSPKLAVKEGHEVKAGTPLFYDKTNPEFKVVAPVSGEVVEIKRGAKRRLLEIKILADKEVKYENFNIGDFSTLDREKVKTIMSEAGAYAVFRQRPFDVIVNPNQTPRSIFVTAFDSSPLAPDYDFVVHGKEKEFQAGLDVLTKLTDGKVYLTNHAKHTTSAAFTKAKNVSLNTIDGPHPAGNVGVQIHHIEPINRGEVVWTCTPQDVILIGNLFLTGKYDASRLVALTGAGVKKPKYYKTIIGACIKGMLTDNVDATSQNRVISGNVLTGDEISADGYVGFYHQQVTVIPEGNEPQFLGWLAPNTHKFSLSRSFLSWLMPSKEYNLNTAMNGEERAFVVSGQYEKVFPFDIYPVYLLKAILARDIEKMEQLGIYEVAPEDFALCEFGCTSKIQTQQIVREGLEMLRIEVA